MITTSTQLGRVLPYTSEPLAEESRDQSTETFHHGSQTRDNRIEGLHIDLCSDCCEKRDDIHRAALCFVHVMQSPEKRRAAGGSCACVNDAELRTDISPSFDQSGFGENTHKRTHTELSIHTINTISIGSFGTIFKYQRLQGFDVNTPRKNIEFIAAFKSPGGGKTAIRHSDNEISILRKISKHENIIKLLASFTFNGKKIFLMELCRESLSAFSKRQDNNLSENSARTIILHSAKGLAYLRACGVIHCDIKPDNLLRDYHDNWKWCDFGMSLIQPEQHSGFSGSPAFSSPEIFLIPPRHSFKSDCWAYGRMLISIMIKPDIFDNRINLVKLVNGKTAFRYQCYSDFTGKIKQLKPDNRTIEAISLHYDLAVPANVSRLIHQTPLTWKEETLVLALALMQEQPMNRLNPKHIVGYQQAWFDGSKAAGGLEAGSRESLLPEEEGSGLTSFLCCCCIQNRNH